MKECIIVSNNYNNKSRLLSYCKIISHKTLQLCWTKGQNTNEENKQQPFTKLEDLYSYKTLNL